MRAHCVSLTAQIKLQKEQTLAKYKKRKKKPTTEIAEKKKKPFPIKRLFILLGITALIFAIYQIMIAFELEIAVHIYWILLGVIAMVYIGINRGTFKPITYDDLSDELSPSEKDKIIKEQERRFERSRPLLYVIIAIIFTLIFDTAYIFLTNNLGLKF